MERFEGYIMKSMRTARAARLLAADSALRRARKVTMLAGISLLLLLYLFTLLFAVKGGTPETLEVLLVMRLVVWAVLFLAVLVFLLLGVLYGGTRSPKRRTELATLYVRGLLADTFALYRPRLVALPRGRDLAEDARLYAASYALNHEERSALLRRGALREEGEIIRRRYEEFLLGLLESDDTVSERYLRLRHSMQELVNRWRRGHMIHYGEAQRKLIEHNIGLLMQDITNRRSEFLKTEGVPAYFGLLGDITVYRDPEAGGEARIIPRKDACASFAAVVKEIKRFDEDVLGTARSEAEMDDYAALLQSYEEFTSRYVTVGCQTVDIERCREKLRTAKEDSHRCWSCKKPFHPRHREVCERCGRYVCPRCGRCYCDKYITHRVKRTLTED